ncbi:hypothetical protein HPB52_002312 [Rhipicephalus sanguineus]|uniref:Uncharacterized protein n=1 Tax=Rhipicephalus sanguineus TaxID=34632 RepID=A0A9D4PDZ2_RHISA|nr:hypothetical protein HPB52_002312 [Rhipicephalus sanguineus]
MNCPQRPTPNIAKLRPGWTLVRRKLAMTNPAGPRSTKLHRGPNVIGVHLTDTVTPSKGATVSSKSSARRFAMASTRSRWRGSCCGAPAAAARDAPRMLGSCPCWRMRAEEEWREELGCDGGGQNQRSGRQREG